MFLNSSKYNLAVKMHRQREEFLKWKKGKEGIQQMENQKKREKAACHCKESKENSLKSKNTTTSNENPEVPIAVIGTNFGWGSQPKGTLVIKNPYK